MNQKSVYLHSFHTVLPPHHLNQQKIVEWTLKAHQKSQSLAGTEVDERALRLLERFCLSENQISHRYYECPDVDENWSDHQIYKLTADTPTGVDIESKNRFFANSAKRVFSEFYENASYPSHLLHVTCTGYVSPSPAQVYFQNKKDSPDITHAYHMGCYASLPSVRMAQALAISGSESVDILHTEMCSLHLDSASNTPEQMVVQTLFADGHIKYTASKNTQGLSFKILGIKEQLIADSLDDMTWIPAAQGMKMTLSREVPTKIRDGLPSFLQEMCEALKLDCAQVFKEAIFAIHPGGPKIIEAVQKKLELSDSQVEFSKKILYQRGNMSSATLPHVWKEILDSKIPAGTLVISLAFGPGLTIFGGVFKVSG